MPDRKAVKSAMCTALLMACSTLYTGCTVAGWYGTPTTYPGWGTAGYCAGTHYPPEVYRPCSSSAPGPAPLLCSPALLLFSVLRPCSSSFLLLQEPGRPPLASQNSLLTAREASSSLSEQSLTAREASFSLSEQSFKAQEASFSFFWQSLKPRRPLLVSFDSS